MTPKYTNVAWSTADSAAEDLNSQQLTFTNGAVGVHVFGGFSSATVTLQAKPAVDVDGNDFQNTDIEITAAGIYLSDRFPGAWVFRLHAAQSAIDAGAEDTFNAILIGCDQEGG